jgi:23S rRNA (guanosine2251-2'-O)-methyltransferase
MTNKRSNELIYGAHPIIEVLKAKKRKLISIYTTKPLPRAWERIKKYLPKPLKNIQYVSRATLERMTNSTDHMGVAAWVTPFLYRKKLFDPSKEPFILLLDSIQDVRNLGATLRSAYCTGVDGVVLCRRRSALLTAAALKASAGLAEHLQIHIASSIKQAVLDLKRAGYKMYMTVLDNGEDATKIAFEKPLCIVIGGEATGISKEVRQYGELITLPQRSPDISYNASVAAGIFLFLAAYKK